MEKERIQTWLGLTQRQNGSGQPGADCPYFLGATTATEKPRAFRSLQGYASVSPE